MTKIEWDWYLATAKARSDRIYGAERYKEDLAKALKTAREALLRDDDAWPKLVRDAIDHKDNNIVDWRNRGPATKWIDENPTEASSALVELWSQDERTPGDRVRSFDAILPETVFTRGSVGTRANVASYLMMGIDPHRYPPYQFTVFRATYQRLGYPQSSADVPDEAGGRYEHALGFLDRLLEEARKQGMDRPSTRQDAQSVVWQLWKDPPGPPPQSTEVRHALNAILYGPPGTGKTYRATACAMAIVKGIEPDEVTEADRTEFRRFRFEPANETGRIAMVTFHQNFSYEDFVEGIRPKLTEGSDIGYELRPGIFRRIVDAALADPDRPYVLIIDEINRGNIPKILGELITLIEPSRRIGQEDETIVTLPYSGESFGVPDNLHIIGTMNTADRSILPLDTALRRRFDHVEMMPDPDHPLIADSVADIDLRKMLGAINARISLLLDRERQIGHTYLFNVKDVESLAAKFRTAILPLLAEYFYDDWSKIRHVLGGAAFVVANPDGEHASGLANEGLLDPDTAIHEVLPATAKEWLDPVQYRRIYDQSASARGDDLS